MDINKFRRGLELFSEINPEVNATMILSFLFIAQRGTCTQKALEDELGLTGATASRIVSYWTEYKRGNKEGIGFIHREEDRNDRRYKVLSLTKAGKQFYEKIKSEV